MLISSQEDDLSILECFFSFISGMASKMNGNFHNDVSIGNHKRIFLFIFLIREIRHEHTKACKRPNLAWSGKIRIPLKLNFR